jgi:hypothetical protein
MLLIFQPSLQDSTTFAKDFSSKPEDLEISLESLSQLPKDLPTTMMMHSMWEDLLLFPPGPAAAMEESILFEPNLEYVETLQSFIVASLNRKGLISKAIASKMPSELLYTA